MKKSSVLIITIATILFTGLFALWGATPSPAGAQSPVTAEVDRNQLSTDEALVLTVTVDTSSGQPSRPVLTALDGFQVISSSSGTQISIVNGNMSSAATYRYTLRPLQAGELVIGEAVVDINGQTYQTTPITVNVSQGTGQIQPPPNQTMPGLGNFPTMPGMPNLNNFFNGMPGGSPSGTTDNLEPVEAPAELAGQDFYIEAQVDNPNPYQGEQVIYTFRFYQAANLFDQPTYESPSFTGFWSQELNDQQRDYTTQAAGRTYRVTELQTILFPTVVGELAIDPAKLTIPGDFFTRGQLLSTQPLALNVQALPAGAPASFQGAVGQYTIQAQADKTEMMVNDTVTLEVAIAGQGNVEALADPLWTEGPEWRAFDSEATVNSTIENGLMSGSRVYERLLVPTQAGDLTLPGVEFSYFDPASGTYETVATAPIAIQVQGDGSTTAVPQAPDVAANAGTVPTGTSPVGVTLRPNKAASELNPSSRSPLTESSAYWLLFSVPFILLAGHFGWQRYQQQRLDTASSRRRQKAAQRASRALHEARRQNQPEQIGSILNGYLEEKLDQRLAGYSQSQMAALLTSHGVEPALADRACSSLMHSEMSRYAPAGSLAGGDRDLFTETEQVIDALEKVL